MAANSPVKNGALDAEVKGRVPTKFIEAIDADVVKRRVQFPRASRADVLRDALTEYFRNRALKPNGRDNGR